MTKELAAQLINLAQSDICPEKIRPEVIDRLTNERLTRDEGEVAHFSLFIMAIDVRKKLVYVGHHKKSDKWIPHGGHIDEGELIEQTLEREIWEEWGMRMTAGEIGAPVSLTITEIENPNLWPVCRRHYDIWYFAQVDQDTFVIDPEVLHDEFYEARWMNLEEASRLASDSPSVLEAYSLVSSNFFMDSQL
ncbi:MAG: NUDIX domain-containing protein [Microgenomates group bacterium]